MSLVKATSASITIDRERVGVLPATAVNGESGAVLPWDAQKGELSLELEGYGVRIVRLK